HVKLKTSLKFGALATAALIGLSGCASNETNATPEETTDNNTSEETQNSTLSGSLVGAGASAQGEAQNSWIASFIEIEPDVTITYDPAGSGTGRENFQQGASQYAGS